MKKPFEPNFNTPKDNFSKEELNKIASNGLRGDLKEDIQNANEEDIKWESEQLAKSYGIYLEFNRSIKGGNKDWRYMIRVANPGGGPLTPQQWKIYDELSNKYTANPEGHPSLRITTRQTIQFHWLKKNAVIDIIKTCAENGMLSINGCGDNVRNVMGCPIAHHSTLFNAHEWTQKIASYFQLPLGPYIEIFEINPDAVNTPEQSFQYGPNILNRKFKIGFSSAHKDMSTDELIPDNCVELRTNDVGVAPIFENNTLKAFQLYVGGGQGERNGKPSLSALGEAFCTTTPDKLLEVLDAIIQEHQAFGDRENRIWARLKFVIKKIGVTQFRKQVNARLNYELAEPIENFNYGDRHLHLGWTLQEDNNQWTYGAFIESGRLIDNSPNGKLKLMVRELSEKYNSEIVLTSNQDLLFTNIPEDKKDSFEKDLLNYNFGKRNGKTYSELRKQSGACVGRDTCRLTYTDSEKFIPLLIDELEDLGWGNLNESIGVTGCERQCYRPSTKSIGLVGSGLNRYQFRLFGDVTCRSQGKPLISEDGEHMYLKSIPRENVSTVIDVIYKYYSDNKKSNQQGLGEFLRILGADKIISYLKDNPETAPFMEKPFNTACVIN